jgi:hypothetical protein
MERFTINNSNATVEVKTYTISSSYNNIGSNFFEFFLTAPHLLNDNTLINIRDEDNIDIVLNIPIYLRKQIKIGININFGLKWRYVDDSNDWQDIGIATTTPVLKYTLNDYQSISTFSNYSIDYQISSNGIVQVKESNSSIWQNLVYVSEINKIITDGTFLSNNSNIKTVNINDTYLRVVPFDLYREINILERGYNDDKTSYIFTTDYFIKNGEFITTLKTGDEIWLSLVSELLEPQNLILPDLYDPANMESLDAYWMQQDWFNPNVASFIEDGRWYSVKQGSVVYNGITYTQSSQPFQGVDKSSFDSFSDDTIVYILDNHDNLFSGSTEPVPVSYDEENKVAVLINVESPCQSNILYTFTLTNLDKGISPNRIDILYKLIDLNKVYFWKEFGNFQIGINMGSSFSVNTQRGDLVKVNFFDEERKKVINPILDNERIRFEPYFNSVLIKQNDNFTGYGVPTLDNNGKITSIKIINGGTGYTSGSINIVEDLNTSATGSITVNGGVIQSITITNGGTGYSGFIPINCIDIRLNFIKPGTSTNPPTYTTKWKDLDFADEDVKYQKSKLKNTFIRLSYYNAQNPTVQLLEHYNSVFVDINMMYADYINALNSISGINPLGMTNFSTGGFNFSFFIYNPYVAQIQRTKDIKYAYTNSSEGYYIYLFGNEFKDTIPTDIFMKLEFNNAMTGKRTLFFNRKSSGTPLNNVFFDIPNSLNYVYTKFSVVYNSTLNKFIYYPSLDYNNVVCVYDVLIINFYEAKVQ